MWMLVIFPVLGVFALTALLFRIFGKIISLWIKGEWEDLRSTWNEISNDWKDNSE